jgi:hypothetical protein
MVNLLMFQPVRDIEVRVAVDIVEPDVVPCLKLGQPAADLLHGVIVVWVKTAREESRGCASPPVIVDECPEEHEQKPSVARQLADALALNELRFDRANSGHHITSLRLAR